MAKKTEEKDDKKLDSIDSIFKELKENKEIYGTRAGDEILAQDTISTGSFIFDQVLAGGFRDGCWSRFYGQEETGKTSIALNWGRNWQDKYENGFVIYFNAEGRLTRDLLERSGININPSKFRIIDCNGYDTIYSASEKLILTNPEGRRFFMILDSTDACERKVDKGKDFGQAEKMAGGAAIASAAGRRLSLLFNVSGHHLFLSSQVRDRMIANAGKAPSGGNAPKFYSSLTGEIRKPWRETFIYDDPGDNKSTIIGRICEIELDKTPNEKTGVTVRYPVKYGLKGGVWRNYEAMMMAKACQIAKQNGPAWVEFEPSFYEDMKTKNINIPAQVNGERKLRELFDSNPELVNYILDKAKILS